MGGTISKLRYVFRTFASSIEQYESLKKRIAASPGIPKLPTTDPRSSTPTVPPFWTIPASPIARHGETATLPRDAVDVVIIGSGITGTAIANALVESALELDEDGEGNKSRRREIRVVMIEARDACSGSTGRYVYSTGTDSLHWYLKQSPYRNGGHIGPIIYDEYTDLRDTYGAPIAEEILRFRLAHIPTLISTARDEGLLYASQAREVEGFDVYAHPGKFERAKKELNEFLVEAPSDLTKGFELIDDSQGMEVSLLLPSLRHHSFVISGATIRGCSSLPLCWDASANQAVPYILTDLLPGSFPISWINIQSAWNYSPNRRIFNIYISAVSSSSHGRPALVFRPRTLGT